MGDTDREAEDELRLAYALKGNAKFIARPVATRMALACGATLMASIPTVAFAWAIAARDEEGSSMLAITGAVIAAILATSVMFAIRPVAAITWVVRTTSWRATRWPGYRTPLSGENYESRSHSDRE